MEELQPTDNLLFEMRVHAVAHSRVELATLFKLTLKSWHSSCLSRPGAEITHMNYHAWLQTAKLKQNFLYIFIYLFDCFDAGDLAKDFMHTVQALY